ALPQCSALAAASPSRSNSDIDMERKHYHVTGGTGFLGSALMRRLVGDGHRVRVFDNNSRGNSRRLHDLLDSLELIEGDIRDAVAVERACAGIDRICHLAFVNGTELFYSKPDLVLDVGVREIGRASCRERAAVGGE